MTFGFIDCMGSEAIRHKTGEGLYKYRIELAEQITKLDTTSLNSATPDFQNH
jgi:hypothetical protein